jgi:hypothetical protein
MLSLSTILLRLIVFLADVHKMRMSCEGKRRRRRGLVGSVGVGFWESPNVHVNLQDRIGGRHKSLCECLEQLTGGNVNMLGDGICLSSRSTRDDA